MTSPFLERDGAVGAAVPEHYGNPLGEQRALAEGSAIVDLSDRAVLSVAGPDRLTWLDSMTSQAIAGLAPGESAETLLLDPHGHVEHAIRLVDDGATTWLLVDGDEGEPLAAWLDRMRFRLRVEVADRTAELATIGSLGAPVDAVEAGGVPLVWRDPWAAGPGFTSARGEHPGARWPYAETLVERSTLAGLAARPAAGTLALEALRIAAWRPRLADVDERAIPHELDWLRSAVALDKGCYRGQETVAKVHNLGHPPRRLVQLHLDGSLGVLPARGAIVRLGEDEVGRVSTAAMHYELGPIALALVRRRTDPAATLTVDSEAGPLAAAQEVVVPPDAPPAVQVPRLPRLGAR